MMINLPFFLQIILVIQYVFSINSKHEIFIILFGLQRIHNESDVCL